ncbi:protein LAX PANICLE 2-like [Dioscorea cayenensis subsp. rotundata]|uniref:Protein LAX PANICLE 2-like n=1 Tax=Dioscorea cayennensis subsp. rotundata TaxID=55577 RepID=A0AB40C2A0_DIOCR|nr:protein LAX PANICLE 2-like [Dioscorea cayenensis subsp. rotundata]
MSGDENPRLMELPLFSDKPSGGGGGSRSIPNTSSFMPLFPAIGQQVRQPWGLWTTTTTISPNPMFASSSNRYDYRHHQYMYPRSQVCLSEVSSPAGTGLKIVNPPRRPQAGVWFILQTKQNQGREPFLPQIPKSYLRIKDGRMTVRLLKKYLVNKLGLEDESQVEITCRGQELMHSWTLQYVRDNVWFSGETMTVFLPESPVADQVMTLQYGRPARSI